MKSMGKPSRNVIHGSFTHKNHHKNKFKATNKKMRKNNPVPLTSTINNTTNNNDINDTITAANNIQLRDGALNYNVHVFCQVKIYFASSYITGTGVLSIPSISQVSREFCFS